MNINSNSAVNLGELLRLRRITLHLTLQQLAEKSRTSPSHLGRIEKGTRFPSARVLHRLAPNLGFEENHLFHLAGYLTREPGMPIESSVDFTSGQLDPYVARTLAQEPPEVQHAVLGVLSLLKNLGRGLAAQNAVPSDGDGAGERE
jgi:transcriptional regulator with XRE-family HTH domain